jgi:hypothetical protein
MKFVIFCGFEGRPCNFREVGNLSKWLCQHDAHRFSVLGSGLNAPCFPTRNLGEFLDFATLGLNVNLKIGMAWPPYALAWGMEEWV